MKETYSVSKDFILEAHKAACQDWKKKIEEQFPEVFPKGDRVVMTTKHTGSMSHMNDKSETYYYSIGDRVKVWDRSYHKNAITKEAYDDIRSGDKGTILYNKCNEELVSETSTVSLNLLIQYDNGTLIFSAPNCVIGL
jgi:hypothetical protein